MEPRISHLADLGIVALCRLISTDPNVPVWIASQVTEHPSKTVDSRRGSDEIDHFMRLGSSLGLT